MCDKFSLYQHEEIQGEIVREQISLPVAASLTNCEWTAEHIFNNSARSPLLLSIAKTVSRVADVAERTHSVRP